MANELDILSSSFRQYVVSPLNAFGLGGFVFDVEGDTTVNLASDITDHYLENNASVQDHIAIKPKEITLRRYAGELVYQQDESVATTVQQVVRKLTVVSSFLPTLSRAASQLKDIKAANLSASSILKSVSSKTVNDLTDYWAFLKNLSGFNSKQQQAFMYLKALQESRTLVSVQTPFAFLNNMAIKSVVAVQGEGERYVSDFSITLKQMNFAELVSVPASSVAPRVYQDGTSRPPSEQGAAEVPVYQDRAAIQIQSVKNNGSVPGMKMPIPTTRQGWTDQGLLAPPENL